jgi:UPF0755 protein
VSFSGPDSFEPSDPHGLLFGDEPGISLLDEFADVQEVPADHAGRPGQPASSPGAATRRAAVAPVGRGHARSHLRRRRRRRQFLSTVAVALVVVLGFVGWYVYTREFGPTDYTGGGTGSVVIQVQPGDGADAIGATLSHDGVVRSSGAFTRAAAASTAAGSIQPGFYRLRRHMSGESALALMLDPSAHLVEKVTIPEGTTEQGVVSKLAATLGVPISQAQAAAKDVANLGLPEGYASATGGPPVSAEGFLYPDTYDFDPGTTVASALQQMTSEFTGEDRSISFADDAKKLGITPYQALIIASMAQAEVKFATDAPKVARVILNRIAAKIPLKIDASSVYAAELAGLNLSTVTYSTINSPYNTYLHNGLPPTPIGNPGESSLEAAVTPAAGNWMYYVNGDAAGHLFFTNSEPAFEAAVAACQNNHWGC